ncbi:MAG: hypothetical protein LBI18_10735 [Planctomycetaceae bacterium]|jgi:chromosome segregation ATPase|nr:hypothetical protein [Planctomycetaceae bacterium]
MSIVSFLKYNYSNYSQFSDFLQHPSAEEFVREYREFLGLSDSDETVNDLREQIQDLKEELEEKKDEYNDAKRTIDILRDKIKELETNQSDECTEIDRLVMTIKMLKPSYVKSYKSEANDALSPDEIEEIIYRIQRKSIETELKEIKEIIQNYSQNEDLMKSLKDDLDDLLKRCPYSDLQYKIKMVYKSHFE